MTGYNHAAFGFGVGGFQGHVAREISSQCILDHNTPIDGFLKSVGIPSGPILLRRRVSGRSCLLVDDDLYRVRFTEPSLNMFQWWFCESNAKDKSPTHRRWIQS